MDLTVALAIAERAHADQTDRFGGRVVDHLARVASAVPPRARSVAWLHDILERTSTDLGALRSHGLTRSEEAALHLLTRRDGESYEAYTLRLAFARGNDGRLARLIKLADLDDHIATATTTLDVPPYAWARRHIENAQWRNHEAAPRVPPRRDELLPAA